MLVGLVVLIGILMGVMFIGSYGNGGFTGGVLLIGVVVILFFVILTGSH